jgi:mono/diheme cytochrome c family protein
MPFFRYFFIAVAMTGLLVVGWAGFRGEKTVNRPLEILPDMDDQPKLGEQDDSQFFADGRSGRRPVLGTVPQRLEGAGQVAPPTFSSGSDYYSSGRMGDVWGDGFPKEITVDAGLIRRGGDRFNVYCAVCHGPAGDGKGITADPAYGIPGVANLHLPPFHDPKDAAYRPDGRLFNVISFGQGQMGPYGAMVPVADRWAIIAYIRTLQQAKLTATPAK